MDKRMNEENQKKIKIVKPGETLYLKEGEDFDNVEPMTDKEIIEETEQLAQDILKKNSLEKEETFYQPEDIPDKIMSNEYEAEEEIVKEIKKVDPSKLKVINKNAIDKERDITRALYGGKSTFQVVAAQSGYMAKVLPLVHKDQVNLYYNNLSFYEYKKAVYRVIWEKIQDTSVGKLNWEEWLRSTAVEDLETLFYGIYSSTFPNEGSFRVSCPNPECGEDHEYKVNHSNLIRTADKDKIRKLIDDVSKNSTTIEKMKEFSLIGKNEAVELGESKIVVEIRTPSLFDSLEILRTVPEKTINKDVLTITNLLYVDKMYIPTKDDKSVYVDESNRQTILKIIDSMPINDAKDLQVAVLERVENNRISYSIKNIKCPTCAHETKEVPISVEDVLFTLIFEKTQ
jgi:hypothetical protein